MNLSFIGNFINKWGIPIFIFVVFVVFSWKMKAWARKRLGEHD